MTDSPVDKTNNCSSSHSNQLAELYRIGASGIDMGLSRIQRACHLLGHPEKELAAVQVAGTNGKGSVSAMLEAAFRSTGLRTGLFTSPHIHRFTERIRIDGKEISMDELSPPLDRVLSLTRQKDGVSLTFFEVATLAALLVFQRFRIDVAILEVGLGGRLDATSVVTPRVGVITSIGLDHTNLLGETIAQIANEKAGIIKEGMTLCCGNVDPPAKAVIESVSQKRRARFISVTQPFPAYHALGSRNAFFQQPHQLRNAALACEAFCQFLPRHPKKDRVEQFTRAVKTFSLPCRFEQFETDQGQFLLDGAHNMEAMTALVKTLQKTTTPVSRIIFGALKGKPADSMLSLLLTVCKHIVVVPAPVARTENAKHLADRWQLPTSTIADALNTPAVKGVSLVTGSFFVAAEARRILARESADPPIGL